MFYFLCNSLMITPLTYSPKHTVLRNNSVLIFYIISNPGVYLAARVCHNLDDPAFQMSQ